MGNQFTFQQDSKLKVADPPFEDTGNLALLLKSIGAAGAKNLCETGPLCSWFTVGGPNRKAGLSGEEIN